MPPKIQRQNLYDMIEGKEWKCQNMRLEMKM